MKNQQNKPLLRKQPMLVLSLAVFILIISVGFFYYRYEKKIIRKEQYSNLKTIADLKINQILDWHEERLADANVITESPFIRQNFQRWLLLQDSTLKKDILEHFLLLKYNYKYEDVIVVSSGGKLLLGLNTNIKHIDPETIEYCKKALQDKKAFLSDFYFSPAHDTIHFDVFAPISNDRNVPVAVLVLRVNPYDYLYPLIQSWPTSSKSAETLIIRKDGDSILYENELRHISNTALKLRIPLTSVKVPAVQATLGHIGIYEGLDYRGVRVLADMRPVTGTPWFMIAKVDQSEIFSELRYITVIIIIITILLLLFFGIGISWFYNNRQKNIYRKLIETGTALQESQEEFRTTLYSIGDAVITTDLKGYIRNMNVVAEKLTGWKESEGVKRSIIEVFHIINEESREKVESPVLRVLKEGLVVGLANHTLLISKDGNEIPIADSGAPIRNEKGDITGVVLVFRDQTQERAAQKALQESERKFHEAVKYLDQGYYSVTTDGILIDHNQAYNRIIGIEITLELKGQKTPDFWQDPEDRKQYLNELMAKGFIRNYLVNAKKINGEKIVVLMNSHLVKDENDKLLRIEGTVTDFTERKLEEEQLRKLNRIYSLLSDINQAIVRTRVPEELFKQVCDIGVKQGGFGMAWVGLIEESSQKLQVIAQAGRTDGYHEKINISLNGKPLSYCPIDIALRQGKHSICNIIENEEMAPCQKIAWEHGFRSSASFPLKVSDILKGALTFYSDEPDFFDEAELKLLDELALDISFAMEYSEKEAMRKKAEEALRESREKYYYLYENSPVGMYHTKIDGSGIIEINNSACEMLGFKKEELIGQPSAIRWADPNRRVEILKIMGEYGVATNFDADVLKKDGTILSCLLSMKIFKEKGFIEGFIVNITDRKRAEEALITSEERFRTASESLTDVVYDWDIKEKVDWYGDIDGIMGYPPGEFPRTINGWAETIHPEDKDRVMAALEGHLKGVAPFLIEYRVGRKDGEWRWWSARGTALREDKGVPYKMIGSITDITESKLTVQKLQERDARYKTLVENIPQKIFMKGSDYRWMSVNENFARDLGISPEEIVGKLDHDLFSKELADKYHADDVRIITTGKTEELEEKYVAEGKETWVNTIKTPVRDKNGEIVGLLGIFWDITGRKLAVEEIRKLNAELEDRVAIRTSQLEATNKELEAFSYSVSHDLRAPLRHVSGYVELLNNRFQSDLPEKGRHYLDSIADSVHVMGALIDDLLQFSRSGRTEMHQSDCDMNEIVKEVIESLSKDNPDRKIEWVRGKLASVNGDEAMLRLVWINLLSNAVKFTRPRKKARIEIGVSKRKKELVFFVRDNGVGFDMQYAQKLFGVFQRLHPTEEFEGTGIGLANVQRIVLRHGGRTWAEAEPDKGAVFYFSIPNK